MNALRDKTVIVGVSGGIAAYKTCELVSRLVQNGAEVHVVMTRNATEFVAPLSFETLSRNRVVIDTFDRNFTWEVEHVALAKKANAVIIAPATANVIAKIACGIADDFLTTTVLACKCPVIIAPAMNTAMIENPITVKNIAELEKRGFICVYGGAGYLACGDSGNGRMAEPSELFAAVEKLFAVKNDYSGKRVLVTAGATRAEIDPVRYITNRSSGKMGYCIARAAYERGAEIVFVKGFTDGFRLRVGLKSRYYFPKSLLTTRATTAPRAANTTRITVALISSRRRCTSSRSNAFPFCLSVITFTVFPSLSDLVHSKYPSYSSWCNITSTCVALSLYFSGVL